jgi:hypothetical protein
LPPQRHYFVICMLMVCISIVKPTRCTVFEFIEYHSTCFGRSFRPSSGVQDCAHSIRHMSYRLDVCLLAGRRCFISCPLASSQLTSMTYNWCCVHSLELLMMDEKASETCRLIFNKLENCASIWFYYWNISRCTVPWTSNNGLYFVNYLWYSFCFKSNVLGFDIKALPIEAFRIIARVSR